MRKIDKIFIHHSASDFGDAELIESWHKEQGWQGIGYHFIILNGYLTSNNFKKRIQQLDFIGTIQKGRDITTAGSHVKNHNANSIGICLIHDKLQYEERQLEVYRDLTAGLAKMFNVDPKNILGHYEVDKGKPLCPSLDMNEERKIIEKRISAITDSTLDFIKIKYIDE